MNKIIVGILIYVMTVTQVFAQATLLPNAKQTFLGTTGAPLASGTVTYYVPNSTNKKTTWMDAAQTQNNTNPILLDAAGRGIMFGQGNYRQVVKDVNGVLIWDSFTSAPGSAQPSGATGTDTAPVGTVMPFSGFAIPINWQLAYGQAVSRTGFPDLFTALTIASTGVSCINTSATLTGFASTASFAVGEPIEASCLSTGVTITSIVSPTSITVSSAANATNTVTATVFPWGHGDGATTFNVPDLRGRTFAGADAMGGTPAVRLSATYYGATPTAPGVAGGSQSHALLQTEIPPYTLTVTDPGHSHTVVGSIGAAASGSGSAPGSGGTQTSSTSQTGIVVTSGGSGTPLSIVQPTITVNYIIKVAPNNSGAGGVVSIGGMFGDVICDMTFLCANQTIGLATQPTLTMLANTSATTMTPTSVTFTQWNDAACGNASGDIIYRGVSSWQCLPKGTNGQALALSGGLPAWQSLPGIGTVTSVGLTAPNIFSVSGSPITAAGTLALALTPQAQNLVFAGPSSGSAANPTFRSIVNGDLPPALSATSLTLVGSSANILSAGQNGSTNPAFNVDASTASQVAGLNVKGAATGGTVAIAAIDSGSNTNLTLDAKGSGTISIGSISTGAVAITPSVRLGSTLTAPSLSTVGTIGGSICATAAGLVLYETGINCFAASAASVTIGTTTVASGTDKYILYQNGASPGGTLGEYSLTGTGTVAVMQTAPTLLGHPTIEGVTSTGATGTGNFVFSASPALTGTVTMPDSGTWTSGGINGSIIGATTTAAGSFSALKATTGAFGGATISSNALAVTGTGLFNSSVTFADASTYGSGGIAGLVALGVTPASNHAISLGGGSNAILTFQNAAGPTNSLQIVGDSTGSGGPANIRIGSTGSIIFRSTTAINLGSDDTFLTRGATATLQSGAANALTPIAQTLQAQSALAGSATNAAGANWTYIGSLGTGTGTGGDIIFKTNVKTTTGTAQGTATTALTIKGETQAVNFAGPTNTTGVSTWVGSLIAPIRTVTASGAITVSATTDYFICVNKGTGAATTVNLPASPATGLQYVIKDCKGDAATNNITITPAAGNIDNTSTYVISTNLASVAVVYDGSAWWVF
jgi:hypothetical protein